MKSNIRIIGICGQGPKSGKSEAANLLHKLLNPSYYVYNFWQIKSFGAGPKKLTGELTDFPAGSLDKQYYKDSIAYGWENDHGFPLTYRDLIIGVAEGLKDRISQDIWVKYLFNNDWNNESKWIIDDVRFLPEVRKISAEGGILIKILNKNAEPGEIEIPDQYIKYEIDNNGTLEELENQLKELLKLEELI